MLKRRPTAPAALLLALTLTAGCGAATSPGTGGDPTPAATATTTAGTSTSASGTLSTTATIALGATHADASDYAWDASAEVAVTLADGGSSGGDGVSIKGSIVTITEGGTYRISGSLSDGQLVVDSADEEVVRLVLDGVDIASSTTAPVSVVDAAKVVIILDAESENTLADATPYQYARADVDEPNAALFSTADLTIAGEGSLAVSGNDNDGIASKDGLVIAGGTITVNADDDGIRGKDYLVVTGGTLTVSAGGDALKADNAEDATLGYVTIADGTVSLTAGTDGIDAVSSAIVEGGALAITAGDDGIHADTRLEIHGGTIEIARSYEGLEATQVVISGGSVTLVADDDGLNVAGGNDASAVNGPGDRGGPGGVPGGGGAGGPGGETATAGYYVEMSGGTLVMTTGGDGFDSNGSATVTGGTIVINGPTANNNGAIDVNGEFLISNAVLVAAGSIGMAETPDASSTQATLHLQFDSGVAAGTVVRVQASDGTAIATFEASKPFQSLVISTPDVAAGATYDVLTGGTVSGDGLGGLYLDATYVGGTVIGTVSAGAS